MCCFITIFHLSPFLSLSARSFLSFFSLSSLLFVGQFNFLFVCFFFRSLVRTYLRSKDDARDTEVEKLLCHCRISKLACIIETPVTFKAFPQFRRNKHSSINRQTIIFFQIYCFRQNETRRF